MTKSTLHVESDSFFFLFFLENESEFESTSAQLLLSSGTMEYQRDENIDFLQRENTGIFHHFHKLPNTIIPISNPRSDRIHCHSWKWLYQKVATFTSPLEIYSSIIF